MINVITFNTFSEFKYFSCFVFPFKKKNQEINHKYFIILIAVVFNCKPALFYSYLLNTIGVFHIEWNSGFSLL